MRGKGICYDTGFLNRGVSTHEPFDPEVVERELRIIREDLHCTAVRLTGGDLERLKIAAGHAAAAGLEVWISPFTTDLTGDELLDFLAALADHAEGLRRQGAEVVLLTGSELSIVNRGIVPGETFEDRANLLTPSNPQLGQLLAAVPARVNDLLAKAVTVVRERFGGKVSYASLPFERVDWTPFDIVSTDAGYRSTETADRYADNLRAWAPTASRSRSPSSAAAPTRARPIRPATTSSSGTRPRPARPGSTATTPATRTSRPPTCAGCSTSSPPRTSTAPLSTPSPATTCRTAATPTPTWTWPAAAWSRSSRTGAARPTPTWPGSPRPRSPPSPTTIAADRAGVGTARFAEPARAAHDSRCRVPMSRAASLDPASQGGVVRRRPWSCRAARPAPWGRTRAAAADRRRCGCQPCRGRHRGTRHRSGPNRWLR
jgi:hypothetical protein